MDSLVAVDVQLDDRIDALNIVVRRLDRNRCILRRVLSSDGSSKSLQLMPEAPKIEPPEIVSNEFDKLDGILNLAKEIRASSNRTASVKKDVECSVATSKSKALPSKSTKAGSRQTLGEALISNLSVESQPTVEAHPPPRESVAAELAAAFRDEVREQLLFLSRYRIPSIVSCYLPSKAKYIEEAKLLSKLARRSQHPHSVPYQVIRTVVPPVNQETPHSMLNTSSSTSHTNNESIVTKLAVQFQALIASYERHLKQRVTHESFKVAQLSADDKRSLVTLWLKGRKLLELFEHYMKTKRKLACTCEHCAAAQKRQLLPRQFISDELEHAIPAHTALYSPSVQSETDLSVPKKKSKGKNSDVDNCVVETVWSYNAKRQVEEYHRTYLSKVMFVVESAVGQDQLRSTVHALKSCCEEQSKTVHGTGSARMGGVQGAELQNKWIESLKQFRLVYSILVNEAQHMHHCMFLNK